MEKTGLTVLLLSVLGFAFYRFSFIFPSSNHIETELEKYWASKGFNDIDVLRLTSAEKIQYGIPLIHLSRFTDMVFSFITTIPYRTNRKVEMVDENGSGCVKFVEVIFVNGVMTKCNELDTFNI